VPRLAAASSLLLSLLPSLLATALFRLSAFALAVTFLDYWAAIPLALLWLANLCVLGLTGRAPRVSPAPGPGGGEGPRPGGTQALLLNATTGLFFPSCHLLLPPGPDLGVKRLQRILAWQRRSLQLQTIVINTLVLVIVGVLFFLVTVSTDFNYNTNILSPLWFNTCILLLVLSFFISLFLAAELGGGRPDPLAPSKEHGGDILSIYITYLCLAAP
jgi:hypothetical protein